MGRLGIRIANAALFAFCAFQVAGVVNEISADLLMPGPTTFAEFAAVAPQSDVGWDRRKPILDRNLFGAQIFPVDVVVDPEPVLEDLAETKLPLRLLGTLLSAVPEHSKAAIAEKGRQDHALLHEGESLERHPQVQVAKIERGRVILQNGAKRVELLLEEVAPGAPTPPARRDRSARRSRRSSRSSARDRPGLAERLQDLELSDNASRNARSLFNQAKIIPKWAEGAMVGMELRDVESGSLYEKVGLKDGDVIKSFNGIPLDSTAAGAKVLSQFADAEAFEIELADGTGLTVTEEEIAEFLESGD